MSVIILGAVSPGFVAVYGAQEYTATAVTPHTRKGDNKPTVVVTWRTVCRECGADTEFTTGTSQVWFKPFCRECITSGEANNKRDRAREAEFKVERVPDVETIYRAVQKAYPAQMSMAGNAPRRLYAPAVVRDASPDLAGHTLGEVKRGLEDAQRRGVITMATVGRRPCGHALKGFWPRPLAAMRRAGLLPPEPDVFA